jgi:hypothetical protein
LVPIRGIAEALKFDVTWAESESKIMLRRGEKIIELGIGDVFARINQQPVSLDVAPKIIDGRTMVPLRFISESMNQYVEWDTWLDGTAFIWLSDRPLLSDEDCRVDDNYIRFDDYYANFMLIDGKQTKRGITIGDRAEDVIIAYGSPHQIRLSDNESSYAYRSRGYPGTDQFNAIVFVLSDGIVNKVILVSELFPVNGGY